jgi:BCD family chlorophyll transporter-like MFS transporter
LHYLVQVLRPRLGHGSDQGGRRTPWILGGMAILALGGVGAAAATALMATQLTAGVLLAIASFVAIGVGVGASGTSLLVLLAKRVDDRKRAAAATIVWVMMIAGFIVTAATTGHLLDPFTPLRLVEITAAVAAIAMSVTVLALWGVEGDRPASASVASGARAATASPGNPAHPGGAGFLTALAEVWRETAARRFTIFVFVSMLAYSAQDLILEPFAGTVFGFTPGESTRLAGVQHGGVLLGMALVGIFGSLIGGPRLGSLRHWCVGGCLASAAALALLALAGLAGPGWPLKPTVFALGVANGAFAVSAIGAMMGLATAEPGIAGGAADGPLGRGPGDRLRPRRIRGHRRQRPEPLADGTDRRRLLHRIHRRGGAVRAVGADGSAGRPGDGDAAPSRPSPNPILPPRAGNEA